jgi:predicted esterase
MGLAVIGILKTSEQYRIDPKRMIVSGFSGGARCALHLAFVHAGLISGSLSICGADFYEPVPKVKANDTKGYGVWPVGRDMAKRAKSVVRFTFITGDRDPRCGNILDIYEGGFVRNDFHADLINVSGMGHQLCGPDILGRGLDYLDRND